MTTDRTPAMGVDQPTLRADLDALVCSLNYGPVRVTTGTMRHSHKAADPVEAPTSSIASKFSLNVIPHVDWCAPICGPLQCYFERVEVKGTLTDRACLIFMCKPAPVAELPVFEMISAAHIIADSTHGLGRLVHVCLH